MMDWYDSLITASGGVVVHTYFLDTSGDGVPLWNTVSGEGYVTDGKVFYTGRAMTQRSMGVGARDFVHHSAVVSLGGPIG